MRALETWGEEFQIMILIEEMAELTKAVLKYYRGGVHDLNKVAEECADVEIMIEQLKVIGERQRIGFKSDVDIWRRKKRVRLSKRIKNCDRDFL